MGAFRHEPRHEADGCRIGIDPMGAGPLPVFCPDRRVYSLAKSQTRSASILRPHPANKSSKILSLSATTPTCRLRTTLPQLAAPLDAISHPHISRNCHTVGMAGIHAVRGSSRYTQMATACTKCTQTAPKSSRR